MRGAWVEEAWEAGGSGGIFFHEAVEWRGGRALMEQKYRHRWRDRDSDGIILEYIIIMLISSLRLAPKSVSSRIQSMMVGHVRVGLFSVPSKLLVFTCVIKSIAIKLDF